MDILNISHRVEAVKYNHSETQFCLRMLDRIDFVPILTYVGFFERYGYHEVDVLTKGK